ncbi:MAG: transcription termination factor Rho [Phycisphaerae bacterium]
MALTTRSAARDHRVAGLLEPLPDGWAALRDPARDCPVSPTDAMVRPDLLRRWSLRGGELVEGLASQTAPNRRRILSRITAVDGLTSSQQRAEIAPFERLTVINPDEPLRFETPGGPIALRVIDLMMPIGKGQRGLIVAPPRTGKTTLLKQIANAIAANYPQMHLLVLLVDERPEEVTDIRRTVRAEVFASSKDRTTGSHVRLARLIVERARRLVELGNDVCLLLDSLTRLGRAFNAQVGTSGRTMTGGLDIHALQEPKRIFGAARNIENGGSLTIIASALIQTGSRADDFIFQEFKGTGNMEMVLSRELAERRIWPAVDLRQSGTRKEELLLPPQDLEKVIRLRRALSKLPALEQIQTLLAALQRFATNQQFLEHLPI